VTRGPAGPWLGALAGLLAALAALAAAELTAALIDPSASPVVAVGSSVVDATPTWLEQDAIRTFGSNDKPVLVASVLVVLALLSLLTGALAVRRPPVGFVGVAALALVGAVAAASRPAAGGLDVVPSLVGGAAGALVLGPLLRVATAEGVATDERRRRFLVTALWVGAGSIAVGTIGRLVGGPRAEVAASRAAVRLPAPAEPAAPLPPGSDLAIRGLTPFTTPVDDFYRVDTALLIPQVTTDEWLLRVHGMVDREVELTFDQLLGRELVEADITLTCVSNPLGGPYAGTARWLGARLADVLRDAGVRPEADLILSRSVDGLTIGTPTAVVMDGRDALLAVGMDGAPLPPRHGFPVRMVVPGLYGYVSATKWVVDLELTRFDRATPYWVERGWAARAPIRTTSRIDVPRGGAALRAGRVVVAGVAWAPHRGISAVEVRVDGGPWDRARLAEVPSADTWRQWAWDWAAAPGRHTLEVRATDGDGVVQTARRAEPFPSGATGWFGTDVTVR
jgi:DMSO/TMAO reductase YedYZ molybdopterin-dependent catalytic subunit